MSKKNQLPCPEVSIDLYHWLLNRFKPSKSTLRLPNGFIFALTDKVVHKIFGIPICQKLIHPKGRLESYWFFKSEISSSGPTPSVIELYKLITLGLVGKQFIRAFMLLALSTFVCPNSRSVCG
jgi:hypothetical protein